MKTIFQTNKDRGVFQEIFLDHWPSFKAKHDGYDDPQYTIPVQKMLDCGKESGGYAEYRCVHCGFDLFRVGFSCKSCFCLSCSKLYVDEFVAQVSKMLHPGVVYRHIVLTLPEQLRQPFYSVRHDGDLLSRLMKTGHQCLEEVVFVALRRNVKIGTMIVVQTHGRSGHYNPHLHIIMTSGGIKEDIDSWFDLRYFKYEIIHKKWQYHLFRMVKDYFKVPEIKIVYNN
ncbi:transposase (IS801 family protein) [Desulforapulum autotrophicum HRM2]|uniref:Transposase (IS801 family protein) n=1 Tax=Desulforapulum autotrophicum (strain ATCC 43914 / DSM 3382 / VKM B-1955 / HRM2) TaxID=177437 RepID=C0QGY7_DESAH|nr:transposase zinc-binding domain-containing protein [Desulforapulum autotrophicum]ACN15636.1 transposase (IS801 family protein) [Desulforapulum autotrophicum HRM2]